MPLQTTGLFGPTVRASGQQPQIEFDIRDCAVVADSELGAGSLSCCNRGPGVIGVVGVLPSDVPPDHTVWEARKVGVFGTSNLEAGVQGISDNHEGVIGQSIN